MGRLPRPIEDGLVYHALNRGNNRADVFAAPEDQEAFLQSLVKTQQRYPFRLLDDEHLLVVLRYIEANPLRAGMVIDLGEYQWSSYLAHGLGRPDPLVSPMPEFDALGRSPAERQSRWRRKVHAAQKQEEIDRVRESLRSGKPLGTPEFVETKAQILGLNLNPRRRGRPPKVRELTSEN